jgi:tetratricopeptide (TPR) repeat protein
MGVDRFYIYFDESDVSLLETLKEYIERGWVVAVDIPDTATQLHAYDHCLQTFGSRTFWLGFIDTDEFLVSKPTLDLKELLKDYEAYAGLAVSSLFFGSNGHQERPAQGQIAAYTRRIHASFKDYTQVKSIIQPKMAFMPYSPHDFIYKENCWCVNEGFLRVDSQDFPSHTEKIQLNHYFCRSVCEMERKMFRGNFGATSWPRKRFEVVNRLATINDTTILQNLESFFNRFETDRTGLMEISESTSILAKMATLARRRHPTPLEFAPPATVTFRAEISAFLDMGVQFSAVVERGDRKEIRQWILKKLQVVPQRPTLYIDLAICYLDLQDPVKAWQVLSQAWQLAPNSYSVLFGMVFYLLWVNNFAQAEKTCHLLLEMAPHDLTVLGFMTEAMLGQGRYEDALKVGVPVVELSAQLGELPDRMSVFLVKKMADYLLEKKDYAGAVRLWQAGVMCQPGEVDPLLELAKVLLLAGEQSLAHQALTQAQQLAPQNEAVLAMLKQVNDVSHLSSPALRRSKRSH